MEEDRKGSMEIARTALRMSSLHEIENRIDAIGVLLRTLPPRTSLSPDESELFATMADDLRVLLEDVEKQRGSK